MNPDMTSRKGDTIEREGGVDTDLLGRIVGGSFKTNIEGIDDKGDLYFYVKLREVGLTKTDLTTHYAFMRTRFFADFVGELVIRYNIDDFVRYMTEAVDPNQYMAMVAKTRHDRFGFFILEEEEALRFQFHISFLQQILSEDINRLIK